MIALHFPVAIWQAKTTIRITMHTPQSHSFVVQITPSTSNQLPQFSSASGVSSDKFSFSAMKIFNRFRKILMRLLFSFPSHHHHGSSSKQRNCSERFDPPKTSCSSYYSSHSHYSEAIADCIEFLNKSSQEGVLDGRKSDVLV
ncbi:hypothetical protein JCGZ_08223 [Jatropha curcas]|uniref:Uncharacterized protein n=1 Tax=Jatropha curcas TaxID=180498 RepID=A0A067KLC1_JATCU|nr:hypothetical protein JCGZ_08223 [Jatropha curcas]